MDRLGRISKLVSMEGSRSRWHRCRVQPSVLSASLAKVGPAGGGGALPRELDLPPIFTSDQSLHLAQSYKKPSTPITIFPVYNLFPFRVSQLVVDALTALSSSDNGYPNPRVAF